jgi:large subunit ribosomal protein L4
MKVDVYSTENQKVGSVDLPDEVFATDVKEAVLWEQVKAQRASRRRGTHDTKTRADVSGGGIKPYRQKGTGRARQGSSRAPNHVGGGKVFGPHPRDYDYRLPKAARRSALRSALSLRTKENQLTILDRFPMETPKTKAVLTFLEKLGHRNVLIVAAENAVLQRSTRNLAKSKFLMAQGINVYDILLHERLVLTQAALPQVIRMALGQQTQPLGAQSQGDDHGAS